MVSIRKFNDFVINENNENAVLMMDDKLNMLESKLKKIFIKISVIVIHKLYRHIH